MVCDRTGSWPERSRFLKQSCAGYKETPHQAMQRQKRERDLKRCVSSSPITPATLSEKYRVFTDMVDSLSRQKKCFHTDKILTCRALAPLGLPKSSGLSRRPILLLQSFVTAELQLCAQALPQKVLHSDNNPNTETPSWSSHCTPYSIDLPRSLWGPPPAPDKAAFLCGHGALRQTQVHVTTYAFENELVPAPEIHFAANMLEVIERSGEVRQCVPSLVDKVRSKAFLGLQACCFMMSFTLAFC